MSGDISLKRGIEPSHLSPPFHGSPWSQNRLNGLKKAVAFHQEAKLHQFTVSEYINDYYYMQPFLEKTEPDFRTLSDTLQNRVHDFLCAMFLSAIKYENDTLLRDNAIFASIKEAVDIQTADQSITAIVCVNDLVAGLIDDYWNYHQ